MEKNIKFIMTRSAPVVKTSTIRHAKCKFAYFITSNYTSWTVEFIYKYHLIHYSTGLILFCSAAWIHLLKNPLTANSCCTHLWFPGGVLCHCQSYLITSGAIKGHKMKHTPLSTPYSPCLPGNKRKGPHRCRRRRRRMAPLLSSVTWWDRIRNHR